jgi:hypothetical protein
MHFSTSPGPLQTAGPVRSPQRSQTGYPESTTSPRRESISVTPRIPDSHPELNGDLRMYDFYAIDRDFDSLRNEVQPASKSARTSALPRVIGELQNTIKQSVLSAETSFKRRASEECKLYLTAAKSNQVVLLGKIDDLPESALPAEDRTVLRATCVALGKTLTRMLLQANAQAASAASEMERKRKARDGDDIDSPPGSPTMNEQVHKLARNTPTRDSRKRAQGNADSPVLADVSPKRQKADAISSPSSSGTTASRTDTAATTTTTTTTTAITPGVLSSPPSYLPVLSLKTDLEAVSPRPGSPAMRSDNALPSSPPSKSSPRKSRTLSPQPKPRPRSQLFVAPPDFSTQAPDSAPLHGGKSAPSLALPGVTGSIEASTQRADTDSNGQQQ